PPYTYEWSTGANTQDISGVAAGYYRVAVYDSDTAYVEREITLSEPELLVGTATAFEYPNDFNVSCHSCYNGSIDASAAGGVAPYTYAWRDGAVVEDRSGLGARDYTVTVSDANGCEAAPVTVTLREPQRNDWTMSGNAGTDPVTQYIGTSDNKNLVLRTNGIERISLLANGEIKFHSIGTANSCQLLYLNEQGLLKSAPSNDLPVCTTLPWFLGGNNNVDNTNNRIGTNVPYDLLFVTNLDERMRVTVDGKIGIGTIPPIGPIDQYRVFVEDGIVTRDVLVKHGTWPDHVFQSGYRLMPLNELRAFLQKNHHLPGIPSATEVEASGGAEVGDIQRRLLETIEQQALYILHLEERLGLVEQRLRTLDTSR
nr:SprB repeat-containing protein [Flavobacteriales bacterium]